MTMSMTAPTPADTSAPAQRGSLDQVLRVVVALFGLFEGLRGLSDLPLLFGGIDLSLGGALTLASTALHPLAGFAAFGFALAKRVRVSVAALAVFALVQWASDVPSDFKHGLHIGGDVFMVALLVSKTFIQPLAAVAALVAARHNRYLVPATLGLLLPTLVEVANIVAFAIAVRLYGF